MHLQDNKSLSSHSVERESLNEKRIGWTRAPHPSDVFPPSSHDDEVLDDERVGEDDVGDDHGDERYRQIVQRVRQVKKQPVTVQTSQSVEVFDAGEVAEEYKLAVGREPLIGPVHLFVVEGGGDGDDDGEEKRVHDVGGTR